MPDLLSPQRFATKIAYLNEARATVNRDCTRMDKSHFTFLVFAHDPDQVEKSLRELSATFGKSVGDIRQTILFGTKSEEIKAQVQAFVDAGITHIDYQCLETTG